MESFSKNELIYDLWETAAPLVNDDSLLDSRKFDFWIDNTRATLIRQDLNKNRTIDENLIQDLGCVEIEKVDASSCCNINTKCYVYRTIEEIPVTIERYNEPTFTRIGPVNPLVRVKNINRTYPLITYSQAIWANNSKYTRAAIYAFLYNKRIHLITGDENDLRGLKYINIRGVFETPADAAKFTTCDGTPCYSNDAKYPMNRWMYEAMKKLIKENDLSPLLNRKFDNVNDGSPEIKDTNAVT